MIMTEYIDKTEVQAKLIMNAERWTIIHETGDFGPVERSDDLIPVRSAIEIIKNIPSVEAVPVVHGKWKKEGRWSRGRMYRCDQCGNYLDFRGVNAGRGDANYCPNCGARMDAVRKDNG